MVTDIEKLIIESSEQVVIRNGHSKWLCHEVRDPRKMIKCNKLMCGCHGVPEIIYRLPSTEIQTRKKWHKKKVRQFAQQLIKRGNHDCEIIS